MIAIHEAMLEPRPRVAVRRAARGAGSDDPEWDARVTTRVPCADYFGVRDQALLAHATQIDPDGPWFVVPREIQAHAWPTEDYELVTSHVETSIPEDDLFAGVTPDAEPCRSGGEWPDGPRVDPRPAAAPRRRRGASDPVPAPEDVEAGWTALLVFVGLVLAVVVPGVQPGEAAAQGAGRPGGGRVRGPAGRPRRGGDRRDDERHERTATGRGGRYSAASRRWASVNSLAAAAAGAGMPAALACR